MFKFDCKISNRSKYWNLSTTKRDQSKCWNFSEKGEIDQMLFFYCQSGNQSKCLNLIEKKGIDQNIETEDKIGNQSKCWNLSTNHQIVQNVVFWVKSGESIKKLTFECNKVGTDQNVKIWAKKGKSIKCWYSIAKVDIYQIIGIWLKNKELIRILKFEDNIKNRSKCWNLSAKCQFDLRETIINQNVEIWVKGGDWSNVDILLPKWELIKMLEFNWKIRKWSERWNLRTTLRIDQNVVNECKMSSPSKCWNLSEKGRSINMSNLSKRGESIKHWNLKTKLGINQNAEIWVLITKSLKMLYFEWKVGNQSKSWHLSAIRWNWSKCWNLSAKCQIDQNVEIWAKKGDRSNVDLLLQK